MIIDCPKCNQYVEVVESGGYDYPAHQNGPGGRYRLVSCGICCRPMVVCQENLGNLADGDIWDQPFRVFPEDENFINPEWPAEIQNAYHEAVGCFKAHSYTATVIMCRKIIDGLCTLQGVNERNLDLSLKKLRDNGVIDTRLYDWANALRLSGNEAVHDLKVTFDHADASDLMDLTSAILEYIYSFTQKFDQFMERRAKAS
jgi:hypothetical protein